MNGAGQVGTDDEVRDGVTEREFIALRRLAGKNFSRFAVAVQHVGADVQLKVLEQLPEFAGLATDALASVSAAFEATLHSNDTSEAQLHAAYLQWREALLALLDDPDLSLDDKLRITAEIGKAVDAQARKDSESKAFKSALLSRVAFGALATVGVVVLAVVGGRVSLEQSGPSGS